MRVTPSAERPRERLSKVGPRALSFRELLALLLGSGPVGRGCLGLAEDILAAGGHPADSESAIRALCLALDRDGPQALVAVRGLGPAGRSRLVAAYELGRRWALLRESSRVRHSAPLELDPILRRALARIDADLRTESREWLGFVPIYRNGSVGEVAIVARGAASSVTVDPQELFARILGLRPAAICLFHNHPSGDLSASGEDVTLTLRVDELCRVFGITLLGHWIVAERGERSVPWKANCST